MNAVNEEIKRINKKDLELVFIDTEEAWYRIYDNKELCLKLGCATDEHILIICDIEDGIVENVSILYKKVQNENYESDLGCCCDDYFHDIIRQRCQDDLIII